MFTKRRFIRRLSPEQERPVPPPVPEPARRSEGAVEPTEAEIQRGVELGRLFRAPEPRPEPVPEPEPYRPAVTEATINATMDQFAASMQRRANEQFREMFDRAIGAPPSPQAQAAEEWFGRVCAGPGIRICGHCLDYQTGMINGVVLQRVTCSIHGERATVDPCEHFTLRLGLTTRRG